MGDLSYPKLRILIDIYLAKINTEIDIRTLASYAKKEPSTPYFREMLALMQVKGALIFKKKIGISIIYTVNTKKLSDLIRSTKIFNKIGDFISKDTLLYNY